MPRSAAGAGRAAMLAGLASLLCAIALISLRAPARGPKTELLGAPVRRFVHPVMSLAQNEIPLPPKSKAEIKMEEVEALQQEVEEAQQVVKEKETALAAEEMRFREEAEATGVENQEKAEQLITAGKELAMYAAALKEKEQNLEETKQEMEEQMEQAEGYEAYLNAAVKNHQAVVPPPAEQGINMNVHVNHQKEGPINMNIDVDDSSTAAEEEGDTDDEDEDDEEGDDGFTEGEMKAGKKILRQMREQMFGEGTPRIRQSKTQKAKAHKAKAQKADQSAKAVKTQHLTTTRAQKKHQNHRLGLTKDQVRGVGQQLKVSGEQKGKVKMPLLHDLKAKGGKPEVIDFNFKGFGISLAGNVSTWQPGAAAWYAYVPDEELVEGSAIRVGGTVGLSLLVAIISLFFTA